MGMGKLNFWDEEALKWKQELRMRKHCSLQRMPGVETQWKFTGIKIPWSAATADLIPRNGHVIQMP